MELTIRDFMNYALEEDYTPIEVWDCETEETLFEGYYGDMPTEYDDVEIGSWNLREMDGEHGVCFNI